MLLILMVLASAAMADDAKMKALLVGTWKDACDGKTTYVFHSDGKWLMSADDTDPEYRWDIKGDQFIEMRPPNWEHSFTILLLTRHQFLAQANSHDGEAYIFFKR
jgi:Family of unknown function (DUF5640)